MTTHSHLSLRMAFLDVTKESVAIRLKILALLIYILLLNRARYAREARGEKGLR